MLALGLRLGLVGARVRARVRVGPSDHGWLARSSSEVMSYQEGMGIPMLSDTCGGLGSGLTSWRVLAKHARGCERNQVST